jgi:hypothetical protein
MRLRLTWYDGETRDTFGILVGKPLEKQPFETTRREWENDINIDLMKILRMVSGWISPELVSTAGL